MEASMKERNYRTVNTLRQQNQREQRRLDERLNSKMGLKANYQSELKAVSREQQRIRQELVKVKKTVTTTWGILPPRHGVPDSTAAAARPARDSRMVQLEDLLKQSSNSSSVAGLRASQVHDSDKSRGVDGVKVTEEKTEDDEKTADGGVERDEIDSRKSEVTPRSKTKPVELSLAEVSVDDAKDNVAKRLAAPDSSSPPQKQSPRHSSVKSLAPPKLAGNKPALTPIEEQTHEDAVLVDAPLDNGRKNSEKPRAADPKAKKKMVRRDSEKKLARRNSDVEVTVDQDLYTHDGTLRTMHRLPDFDSRIAEAKKARYIRHKGKVLSEQELTVRDIFAPGNKSKQAKK